MREMIQIVTAVNNQEQYERYIKDNPFYKGFDLVAFDNTIENQPIPVRYNTFIEERMLPEAWVLFCHQDFSIREDIVPRLMNLPRDCIYGPIGVERLQVRALSLKMGRWCFSLRRNKKRPPTRLLGEYLQGFEGDEGKAERRGIRVTHPSEVETLDACCIILHASLIRKLGLRFDPRFPFSLFAEDLSIHLRHKHGIQTKVLQLECFHLSTGGFSAVYYESLLNLMDKYPDEQLVLTGSAADEIHALRYLQKSPHAPEILKFFNTRDKRHEK